MTSENKAPERIWADPPTTFDGMDIWREEPCDVATEYVRADLYAAQAAEIASLTAERDYDRKQSEHKSSVIDKLNAALASASIQPAPEVRQEALAKAWMMAREDAVGAAKHAGLAFGYERAVQAIRALTPPADLAARIGGAE